MVAFLIFLAIIAYVYWRLDKSNMTVPPSAEQYTDESQTEYQTVVYVQPRTGESLPRT